MKENKGKEPITLEGLFEEVNELKVFDYVCHWMPSGHRIDITSQWNNIS